LRKTLHKQTDKQTDRQTDRHYENNGQLAVNQQSPRIKFMIADRPCSRSRMLQNLSSMPDIISGKTDYAACLI